MFIYEFMSGVTDTIQGGEDEESYDPHMHRKVEKPTSYVDTMIHLLKGSIGAGILAMPDAVSRMGLIYGLVSILLIGAFATYCIHLLINAQYILCKRLRKGYLTYPKSMVRAVENGPSWIQCTTTFFSWFVDTVLVVWQVGLCCVYIIFVAENVKQVCDFYGYESSIRWHIVYILPPLTLINIVKDLKLLTPLSTISNMVTIIGLLLVFFYLIEDDVEFQDDKLQIKSTKDIFVFIGITLFALEAVGVILALEYNMENPKQFMGMFGLFNIGMLITLVLYSLVGVCGYLKYGNEVKASITLNLPREQKKAQVAKLVIAIAIFLTEPLQIFVAYNIIWRHWKKKLPEGSHKKKDYLLRIWLVIIPWCVSLLVPMLGPFISLFGALCLSLLAIIFPGIIDVCIWYPDRYGFLHYKLLRDLFIISAGVICLCAGCYTSMLEIVEAYNEH